MEHIASAIVSFGEQMGFSNLHLNSEGALNLVLEGGDTFSITTIESGLIVSIAVIASDLETPVMLEQSFRLAGLALHNEGIQMSLGFKDSEGVQSPAAIIASRSLANDQVNVDTLFELFEEHWAFREQLKG